MFALAPYTPMQKPNATLCEGKGYMSYSLHTKTGQRKYLNQDELQAFIKAAATHPEAHVRTFTLTLAYTGARLSEVLETTKGRLDAEAGTLTIRSLKKRKDGVFRTVNVPASLVDLITLAHKLHKVKDADKPIWDVDRVTAWRWVKEIMEAAQVRGPQASPKGLRHGFAANAIMRGVPLNIVQKWLGHSRMEMTAIYADLTGPDERHMASRMWEGA